MSSPYGPPDPYSVPGDPNWQGYPQQPEYGYGQDPAYGPQPAYGPAYQPQPQPQPQYQPQPEPQYQPQPAYQQQAPYQPQPAYPPQPGYPPIGPAYPRRSNNGLLIGLAVLAAVLVLGGAGTVAVLVLNRDSGSPGGGGGGSNGGGTGSEDLSAVVDYRTTNPAALSRSHSSDPVDYPMTPPAGGVHHPTWQSCDGQVYDAPIVKEKAVHSLEHGAVWITYQPGLDGASVEKLAKRVRGLTYIMLSPYPGQDPPISLQAWGYQLAVNSADDRRIDAFVRKYRVSATVEPGAPCSGGETATA